ncbi:MazG family protein [Microbacterium laevaniformans]|uniref:MazG family protein n=1 Tax=Microbacterium laevaniformans TaxID=36807 RepID=UPI0036414A83
MASSTPEHGDRLSPIDPASTSTGDALRRAADVMAAVRARCVWSARITHEDLVPYLVEEAAELIDAVEAGTRADLREELGDLLWQVLFHAAVAADATEDPFDIDDVADALAEKMIRRHPHVFGDAVATTPEEVLVHWNAAKAAEKQDRRSVLDGVSAHMPSLALAQKLLGRAAALPLSSSRPDDGRGDGDAGAQSEEQLGTELLGLVARAQRRGWDAERALRGAIRRLEDEVRAVESASASGDLEE